MLAHVSPVAGCTTQGPACCGWAKQQGGRGRSRADAAPPSERRDNGRRTASAIAKPDPVPTGLRTELAKVVVRVEVAPTEPGGVGHPSEDRMRLPVEAPRRRRDEL